jgi:hypothetical protein
MIFPIVDKEGRFVWNITLSTRQSLPICLCIGGPPFQVDKALFQDLLEPRGLRSVFLQDVPDALCHRGREGFTALGVWQRADCMSKLTVDDALLH